jgi:phosphatidylglycerol---prolipoprotein diacylglyceryl transferase
VPAPRVDAAYVALMVLAIALGGLARVFVARTIPSPPLGLSALQRGALLVGAIVGGALGAKLPYVLADPEGAISGAAWLSDGRTITWGLAFGYLGVELAKWLSGVRVKTGDDFAIPVAVSIGAGRAACFHAGCCFGAETSLPWGVDFGDGTPRHPNQLYELAFHFAMASLLYALAKRKRFPRQRIKLYIIAYMLFRVVAELWRPERAIAGGLTFYQLSALAFAALFTLLWWIDARSASRKPVPG